MIVPGSANPLLLASGAGYQIANALRFRASNSAYLSWTTGSAASDRKYATVSIWLKRGALTGRNAIYAVNPAGTSGASNQITMLFDNTGSNGDNITYNNGSVNRTTTSVYRDPSAHLHFHQVFDTTQATAADRVKTAINGVILTDINIGQDFSLNANTPFGQASVTEYIGRRDSGLYFDGLVAEIIILVGQALPASSFGQTDAATGVWVPKKFSGTFGSLDRYYKFADASAATAAAIGKDSSGNGLNATPSGISVTAGGTFDQSLDTPTLNYPVISPLNSQSVVSITEAGMASNYGGASNTGTCIVSVPFPTTGKWYYEHTCLAVGAYDYFCGVFLNKSIAGNAGNIVVPSTSSNEYAYRFTGEKMIAGVVSAYGSSYTANDVIGVAFDATNLTIEFFKNNVSQGQLTGMPSGEYIAFTQQYGGGSTRINFGQRPFAYTPPSGFKALNTANLSSTAVTTSGSFTGNAAADGPFVWTNGNPATLTINGNAVTFGTHADKTAGGFKLRSSSSSYNASGSNSWTATAGKRFVQSKKPNNAQTN